MRKKEIAFIATDILLINLSIRLAFFIRFGNDIPFEFAKHLGLLFLFVTVIRICVFYFFRIYKIVFKYIGTSDLISIITAISVGSALIVTGVFFTRELGFPRTVIIIDWLLSIVFICGVRFLPSVLGNIRKKTVNQEDIKRALIVGAGDMGEMVVREMEKHKEKGYIPVGFIDDDKEKKGLRIHNVEVLGLSNDIVKIVNKKKINEIIIALPDASPQVIQNLIKHCENAKVKFKIIPSLHDIMSGDVSINQIREVEIEDLLGREPISIDLEEIASYLRGKNVLITGAGGSIGSELCRQVMHFEPANLVMIGQGENSIYNIETEMKRAYPDREFVYVIADVKDVQKIEWIIEKYRPKVVFHAAAHKHVPMMEHNIDEAVKNNIFGTKSIALASLKYEVEKFVLISTDKAVNPTSVMGVTKRVAEMTIQSLFDKGKTDFMAVRFGNVLGSRGSVVPLFKHQIAQGGPVTITHPDIIRYFMTVEEAVQLVIQAGAIGKGGEVFVLDMGQPVKIVDLARNLITLSGFKPDEDIKIEYTGLRPGEKLYEEMLTKSEGVTATNHKKIFIAKPEKIDAKKLNEDLNELLKLSTNINGEEIINKLQEIVPAYKRM